jgi:hypothetical protein
MSIMNKGRYPFLSGRFGSLVIATGFAKILRLLGIRRVVSLNFLSINVSSLCLLQFAFSLLVCNVRAC